MATFGFFENPLESISYFFQISGHTVHKQHPFKQYWFCSIDPFWADMAASEYCCKSRLNLESRKDPFFVNNSIRHFMRVILIEALAKNLWKCLKNLIFSYFSCNLLLIFLPLFLYQCKEEKNCSNMRTFIIFCLLMLSSVRAAEEGELCWEKCFRVSLKFYNYQTDET